jgi:hypothetical protein
MAAVSAADGTFTTFDVPGASVSVVDGTPSICVDDID